MSDLASAEGGEEGADGHGGCASEESGQWGLAEGALPAEQVGGGRWGSRADDCVQRKGRGGLERVVVGRRGRCARTSLRWGHRQGRASLGRL